MRSSPTCGTPATRCRADAANQVAAALEQAMFEARRDTVCGIQHALLALVEQREPLLRPRAAPPGRRGPAASSTVLRRRARAARSSVLEHSLPARLLLPQVVAGVDDRLARLCTPGAFTSYTMSPAMPPVVAVVVAPHVQHARHGQLSPPTPISSGSRVHARSPCCARRRELVHAAERGLVVGAGQLRAHAPRQSPGRPRRGWTGWCARPSRWTARCRSPRAPPRPACAAPSSPATRGRPSRCGCRPGARPARASPAPP